MIACVEALNYRCLHYVRQEIGPFQVLVGPNASGKSTFLDAIALLGDLLDKGVTDAVYARSPDLHALTWMGEGERFEIAVELVIPDDRRSRLPQNNYQTCPVRGVDWAYHRRGTGDPRREPLVDAIARGGPQAIGASLP